MSHETPSREKELLADLSSNKRTVKVAAIVELSKIASDPAVLRGLQKVVAEGDREFSLFASQAVSRIQARIGKPIEVHFTGETLTLDHLNTPLPAEIPALLAFLRRNPHKVADELRPAAAEFLGKHGNLDDAALLRGWLEANLSVTSLSLLDALEAVSPKDLAEVLPKLLASEHPLVRVRAIQTLRRTDPDEAFAHLSELLASRKAEERIAAISYSLVFPFDRIKPMVFAMLNEESDADVLRAVEVLFTSNPELDCALRMLDLLDVVSKESAAHLTRIFRNICVMLKMTGLATAEEANPDALIARWKKERLKKFLGTIEIQLQMADQGKRQTAEAWLAKNLKNPEVATFVGRLKENPATEEVYQRLTGETLPRRVELAPGKDPASLNVEDKMLLLDQLTPETFLKQEAWVRGEADDGEPRVRATALHALRRHSDNKHLAPIAEKALQAMNPETVMAGFRLLEKIDTARLATHLPELLKNESPLVRGRAIKVSLKTDPERAVESLIAMLRSPDSATRAQAAGNLMVMPFDKVHEPLMEVLRKESLPDIARQVLAVFLANPSSKVLDSLDHIQNAVSPAVGMLIAQTRMDLFDLILQYGLETFETPPAKTAAPPIGSPDKRDDSREGPQSASGETPAENPVTSKSAPPSETPAAGQVKGALGWAAKPYAVSEVRNTIRKREAAGRVPAVANAIAAAVIGPVDEATHQKRLKMAGVLLAACCLFLIIMFIRQRSSEVYIETGYSGKEDEQVNKNAPDYIPSAFRIGGMCRLTGKISQVNEDGSVLFISGDKTLYVTFRGKAPTVGSAPVEIDVLPYRKAANGYFLANGFALKEKK